MKQPLHEAELEAILTDPQPESVNSCPDDFPFQGVQDTLTCPAWLWGCTLLLAWGVYLPSPARRVPSDCSAAFSLKYIHTCVPITGRSDVFFSSAYSRGGAAWAADAIWCIFQLEDL